MTIDLASDHILKSYYQIINFPTSYYLLDFVVIIKFYKSQQVYLLQNFKVNYGHSTLQFKHRQPSHLIWEVTESIFMTTEQHS